MFGRLLGENSGAAAAEMALVAPLLVLIMFGSMELGHYFYSEHVVVKAVRDGARFASRQGFADYTCPGNGVNSTIVTDIQRVTRTNQVAAGGTPRLADWTSDASVQVTATCFNNAGGTYASFYEGVDQFPVVKVEATVPYTSLFKVIGFSSVGLQLKSSQEAVVMGI